VNESVMAVLGLNSSGSVISVNARAVLPYKNNTHPRILLRVLWSTVFSLVADTVPYREISIMQGRDDDKVKPARSPGAYVLLTLRAMKARTIS
jgi:hypothetical protein